MHSNMYVGETVGGTGITAGTTITAFRQCARQRRSPSSATVAATTRTTLTFSQPENGLTYYPYSNNMPLGAMSYDTTNTTGTGYES